MTRQVDNADDGYVFFKQSWHTYRERSYSPYSSESALESDHS